MNPKDLARELERMVRQECNSISERDKDWPGVQKLSVEILKLVRDHGSILEGLAGLTTALLAFMDLVDHIHVVSGVESHLPNPADDPLRVHLKEGLDRLLRAKPS
jgi:hypothetical protein